MLHSCTYLYDFIINIFIKHRCFISYSFRYHSPSIHSCQLLFYLTCVVYLFNFFRHYKSPPFRTVFCIHLIRYFSHILVFVISFYFNGANINVNVIINDNAAKLIVYDYFKVLVDYVQCL